MFNKFSYFGNRAVYEIMWKRSVEPVRPQMAIWHMRIACWITKTTQTLSLSLSVIICNNYCFFTAKVVE